MILTSIPINGIKKVVSVTAVAIMDFEDHKVLFFLKKNHKSTKKNVKEQVGNYQRTANYTY